MEGVFVLFACCIPVKGARRSTICDLQRSKYYFIPNALYEILTSQKGKKISEIIDKYGTEHENTILDYFSFLREKELGFITNEPQNFPDMSLEWQSPSKITNAIIDVNRESAHPYPNLFNQLEDLGCATIQLRFYDVLEIEELNKILKYLETSRIRTLEIILRYSDSYTADAIRNLYLTNTRITNIVFHNAKYSKSDFVEDKKIMITYIVDEINDASHCGLVHPAYFTTNTALFTESQHFNSCLNRKISIDTEGRIKQCPSMKNDFGNIAQTKLEDIILLEEFHTIWGIKKDAINICKDCEFRHICTDCRGYTENDDPYGKPAKCSYDPYKAEWENEADNPTSSNYKKQTVETI